VVQGDRTMSYRELNERANQTGHHLRSLGVKPETLVAVCLERSVEMVVGILGILKAGGAYVPLDPAYPNERLAFILEDSGAPILLTQRCILANLPPHVAEIVCLDAPFSAEEKTNPPGGATPENLAYVIYTSGSTGRPKGVAIEHRSTVALIQWAREFFTPAELGGVLFSTSVCFDLSVFELFVTLCAGGTVVVAENALALPTLNAASEVTLINTVPSVMAELVRLNAVPASVRVVNLAGEPLARALVRQIYQHPGVQKVYDLYGPTEDTTYSTAALRRPDGPDTIGRPIANRQLYILDAQRQPVSVGAGGEIYLGGDGLARGYLNRPELTAEKFVPHPFSHEPGARLYRTGDLGRFLPDGSVQFLGRLDHQVKIRGFRIEPGEIESVLAQHPSVREAVVIVREEAPGDCRLVAYVVPHLGHSSSRLVDFLKKKLPHYMVPAAVVELKALPRTPNGKIDRAALPCPVMAAPETRGSRPLSPAESRVLDFCREILGLPGLDSDVPLLEAGMHSLALFQLTWRIRKEFGAAPAFSEMFARRTAAEVASLVEATSAGGATALEAVTPADRNRELPLSFAQEGVWFLEQLHPDNRAYHFQSILRFRGRLDVPALEKALNTLVKRHEILRTTFPQSGGRPFQQIHPFSPFTLPVEDASKSRAEQRIGEVIREPFDLERLPLARWILFRLGGEEHWLLHTEHHLLHDGWEYGVFLKELFASYDALAAGRQPSLPALTVQFADFAVWQRRQLASGRWDGQLDYWQKRLHTAPPAAQLPSDRPRPTGQTFAGGQIREPLDGEFHAHLLAACAREGVTPYMWLLAAFQVFLYRYTGQDDVVVGSGFANRQSPEVQKLLGMVINTVALRVDFSGLPSFREALAHLRRAVVEAADNQDAPFDQVIQRLNPGTVLFNTFFDSYDRPFSSYHTAELHMERMDVINNGTCKFDLVVLVIPGEGTPAMLLWEYNTNLFSQKTATRMLRHYRALVSATLANPDTPISRLPMLTAEENSRLCALGRGMETISPSGYRIEELFDNIAASYSQSEAIVCGSERLTYAALRERSMELAAMLHTAGVRSGEVVAVRLPRGVQAIATILAILRCRCAYLPLDPALPEARVGELLRSAGVGSVVTEAGIVPAGRPPRPLPDAWQASAAYVLFTSGSTGQPKAICVPHHAVVRLVKNTDYIALRPDDRVAQVASISFDAATFEIWGALLCGARLVGIAKDVALSPPDFAAQIREQGITTMFLTTALFNQMAREAPEAFRGLRHLLFGGEAVDPRWVSEVLRNSPPQRLLHVYGPTEATTFSTWFVAAGVGGDAATVPIGRPVSHTQIYILNEERQLQPQGVAGEIFIGGTGLALGYLGDAALTAEKFVPDPFSTDADARLYRTGDLGRWLPDGNLEFLGRMDDQVKIRGFRIEPGEIESALAQHPSVRAAAVVAREDVPGERRLVAYVAAKGGQPVSEMHRFLKERLPDYMVPAAFVILDALPMTPSGKVDRRALPAPELTERVGEAAPVPARTPLEQELTGIWAKVLKVDRVGVHDDFFLSGGHSLLALQLIHEINSAFGLELPVRLLFTEPTLAGQACEIERALAAKDQGQRVTYPSMVPLRPGGSRRPFFLVAGGFGGEAELLAYAGLARHLDSQQPFYGLRARGVDELVEPHDTVENMAAEHIAEIRKVQPHGPYFLGGACVGGVVAFEIARQLRALGEEIGLLVLVDCQYPSWSGQLRIRFIEFWRNEVLSLVQCWRHSPAKFLAALDEKVRIRIAPSPEQKVGLKKVQIGRKYVGRMLRYAPKPYAGPVTLIVSEEQIARDPTRVWRDLARGGLDIQHVPGDHITHLREHAATTAARLEACLKAAQTTNSPSNRRDSETKNV